MRRRPLAVFGRRRRLWSSLACFLLAQGMGLAIDSRASGPAASEDAIRAALVQHLTLFVEWPGWKMDSGHPQFNVCLIGKDPIGPALDEAFRGKPVLQKSVSVVHLQAVEKARDCHILYVGANAQREVQHDASFLEQAAVLTISERPGGNGPGQIIGLPKDENHVKIEVNLRGAASSKLIISSRLLRLASITEAP